MKLQISSRESWATEAPDIRQRYHTKNKLLKAWAFYLGYVETYYIKGTYFRLTIEYMSCAYLVKGFNRTRSIFKAYATITEARKYIRTVAKKKE